MYLSKIYILINRQVFLRENEGHLSCYKNTRKKQITKSYILLQLSDFLLTEKYNVGSYRSITASLSEQLFWLKFGLGLLVGLRYPPLLRSEESQYSRQ